MGPVWPIGPVGPGTVLNGPVGPVGPMGPPEGIVTVTRSLLLVAVTPSPTKFKPVATLVSKTPSSLTETCAPPPTPLEINVQ